MEKDLGKRFFIEPEENNGYFRGVERVGKTRVILCASGYYNGIPATVTRINIGLDYKGEKVNDHAEEVRIFDLMEGRRKYNGKVYGRQVIEYLHSAPSFDENWDLKGLVMKPFARRFRTKTKLTVEGLLRGCSNSRLV